MVLMLGIECGNEIKQSRGSLDRAQKQQQASTQDQNWIGQFIFKEKYIHQFGQSSNLKWDRSYHLVNGQLKI